MRKFIVTISVIIGLIICGTLIYNLSNSNVNSNNSGSDLLSTYNYYEMLAKDSLEVFKIHDDDSYQNAKAKLKSKMSNELVDFYFPTEEYTGYELNSQNIVINDIKGDITKLDSEGTIVFKIEMGYDAGAYSDVTVLVTIQNNCIIKIERI